MVNVKIVDFNQSTGSTHKVLGIDEIIDDALNIEIDYISVISSGNYIGVIREGITRRGLTDTLKAVNLVNHDTGMPLEIKIDENIILKDAVEREEYIRRKKPEIQSVRDYTDFISNALLEKARKIVDLNSDFLCVGVGSGKLYLTLYQAIREQDSKTKLIGLLPRGENGVFNDNNLYEKDGVLRFKKFSPKSKADKLVAPYTIYKDRLLATTEEGHRLIEVDNSQLIEAQKVALMAHVDSEISGSAGFIAYQKKFREENHILDNSDITIISTGKGVKPIFIEQSEYQKISSMMKKISTTKITPFVVAGVMALAGVTSAIRAYDAHNQERETLLIVAGIYHDTIKDDINLKELSNSDLDKYIDMSKPIYKVKKGGPLYFQ